MARSPNSHLPWHPLCGPLQESAIVKFESEMKRRADEIERKTREVDGLNRKYERAVAAQPGEP